MTRILAAITALFLLLPAVGRAQQNPNWGLTDADRVAVRQVIEGQLSAFEHDDGPLAFSYASPLVQAQFRTPKQFLDMVKTAYPSIYRPHEVQFREFEATYDGPVQKVFLIGTDGEPVLGLYFMQKESDGSWKIKGCALTPAPDIRI